jgi:hypothetical protein
MGKLLAEELTDLGLELSEQLHYHFTANCYPPVPTYMIEPAIKAIEVVQRAQWGDAQRDQPIQLPEGVSWKGMTTAPAYAFVKEFRLESYIEVE